MKKLAFSFLLRIDFSSPVILDSFTLRCLPADSGAQRVEGASLIVRPDTGFISDADFFGLKQWGCVKEPHSCFEAEASGTVITGLGKERVQTETGMFIQPSPFTRPGKSIMGLYGQLPKNAGADEFTHSIMEMMEKRFVYAPGATGFSTVAEDAAMNMRGVCQDAAHIMLALLRLQGIPCRYVVGYVPGEGATHAWVEVPVDGVWQGFDPVNRCSADDRYIKVSCGRDAGDCPVNRGIFRGNASQISTNRVKAEIAG